MEASRLPRMYGDVSPELAGRIFEVLKNLLLDRQQISPVRQIASQALAQIGIPESAKVIGTAISQEGDPVLRSSFVSDLNALERKK
jgi:HEAT repeat protein